MGAHIFMFGIPTIGIIGYTIYESCVRQSGALFHNLWNSFRFGILTIPITVFLYGMYVNYVNTSRMTPIEYYHANLRADYDNYIRHFPTNMHDAMYKAHADAFKPRF